jgi:hypothetical protein
VRNAFFYYRGSEPDYHIRFNEQLARNDDGTASYDSLLLKDQIISFGENSLGYTVEQKFL